MKKLLPIAATILFAVVDVLTADAVDRPNFIVILTNRRVVDGPKSKSKNEPPIVSKLVLSLTNTSSTGTPNCWPFSVTTIAGATASNVQVCELPVASQLAKLTAPGASGPKSIGKPSRLLPGGASPATQFLRLLKLSLYYARFRLLLLYLRTVGNSK